jgi:hypothetical protein
MATPTTLRLVRSDIGVVRQPEVSESRVRRFFRRKARRRALVSGWREEAALRSMIRA